MKIATTRKYSAGSESSVNLAKRAGLNSQLLPTKAVPRAVRFYVCQSLIFKFLGFLRFGLIASFTLRLHTAQLH